MREAIWQGRLKSGERLPSTRRLAKELGVARNTIVSAYEQLTVEGFIVAAKGSGTCVTQSFPRRSSPKIAHKDTAELNFNLSSRYQSLISSSNFPIPLGRRGPSRPFRAHSPACKEFPSSKWAQLTAKRLRQQPEDWLDNSEPAGYGPLREAIVDYLGAGRGLTTQRDNVVVTAGAQQAAELLAKVLIDPGDVVCFEDPGYTPAAMVFAMAGAKVVSIPVDEQGIDVEQLNRTVKKAKLVYVTPSNQFPLGVTLSQSRRKALLQWAARAKAIIVEDDYNGEYRYRGRPLPTLHAMASEGQVIYLGSFSKLLFPALRLGYMVVPTALASPLACARWLVDRHSPSLEQAVLTDFIDQGHFARHLRRMRSLYIERQQALVDAVHNFLSPVMQVFPLDGGLHLVGWLQDGVEEQALLAAAKSVGIEIMPTSFFSVRRLDRPSVILGYAPYTPDEIHHHVKRLADAYHAGPR